MNGLHQTVQKAVTTVEHVFTTVIHQAEGLDGAYVVIPFDVEQTVGAKRVKVKVWFDGVLYRGSIVRMDGEYLVGLTKEVRNQIGKQPGAQVEVRVEKDEDERTVELPQELKAALENQPETLAFFEKLSYSHKREYTLWIDGAKTDETRLRRIEKTLEMLVAKKTFRDK